MKKCNCKFCDFVREYAGRAAKLDLILLGAAAVSLSIIFGTLVPKKCHKPTRHTMGALLGFSGAALGAKMLVSFLKNR